MNYRLVLIEWEDSQLGFQGWKFINEEPKELPTYLSVGFFWCMKMRGVKFYTLT